MKALALEGVDHIVEVAFGTNVDDVDLLKMGGSRGRSRKALQSTGLILPPRRHFALTSERPAPSRLAPFVFLIA
jgi:hypothetical protein